MALPSYTRMNPRCWVELNVKSRHRAIALLLAFVTLGTADGGSPALPGIVPEPRSLTPAGGTYAMPAHVRIAASNADERNVAAFTASFLHEHGVTSSITGDSAGADVRLSASARDPAFGAEGYHLTVDSSSVTIRANSGAGLFYGLQTFEQLVPMRGAPIVPHIDIVDKPAFRWRGIHLDVSRHFFPVPIVERYIDVAAHYKLNTFHWHLTDDQGWRIEIKRYPRLTETGSCRAQTEAGGDATTFDGKRYCGYYTQAQVRAVVAYAKRRYVTIVPEIEMPGHSVAALAAYPDLACGARSIAVRQTWGVSTEIYCPTEHTFTFLENVLSEVMDLFPGPYVHIGGDEVPKEAWAQSSAVHALMQREHLHTYDDVQGYFDRRIVKYVASKGRRAIGWDEILDGGVPTSTAIMAWQGEDRGAKAARKGYDVVMTPQDWLYFDAYQGDQNDEPQAAIGNLITTKHVYDLNPLPPGLTESQSSHIIGVQGNLWTEYIATPDYLFYMLLPRMLALSEVAWAPQAQRNWNSFSRRSATQYAWLAANGYNFRIPNPNFGISGVESMRFVNVSQSVRTTEAQISDAAFTVTMNAPIDGAVIHYTLDGSAATAHSPTYQEPLQMRISDGQRADVTAITVLKDGRTSTPSELIVTRSSK